MSEVKLYQSAGSPKTIYDRALNFLKKKYLIRYNTIALELEIKLKEGGNWSELNIDSLLIELAQSGIDISMAKLEILVRSHLIDQYDPIREYFESLPEWDGNDHIRKLCSYVKTFDDKSLHYHFEKWLTRTVLCALEKEKVNKQCFILCNTLQNSGKTSFWRFLIPKALEKYYTENISVDKDGIVAICKNFICNADELAILTKTDVNVLKFIYLKRKCQYQASLCEKS